VDSTQISGIDPEPFGRPTRDVLVTTQEDENFQDAVQDDSQDSFQDVSSEIPQDVPQDEWSQLWMMTVFQVLNPRLVI
jgi:hypothetical protein